MSEQDKFEVLPAGAMRAKYDLTAEKRPTIILRPCNVPAGLRILVPWAEKYGIGDDLIREDFFRKAPMHELLELKMLIQQYQDKLDEWLAGPEGDGAAFTQEYLAFSAMRIGVDCMP